jgi:dipeptidyl aminopeptidase/acylaminoacyl peptidase
VSASTFFARVTEPILIHHGTADESCPIAWSRETLAELRAERKNATMFTYPGEQHAFGPDWQLSIRRTVTFFRTHLRA